VKMPGYISDASLMNKSGRISAASLQPSNSPRDVVPQQLGWPWECNFDPSTLTATCCMPCFWGRRRCCTYTQGGDVRCYSDKC